MSAILGFSLVSIGAAAQGAVTVSVSPSQASLPANGSQQFSAAVFGTTNQGVTWAVNGVPGGAPSLGTISTSGLYVAPADVAAPVAVTISAVAAAAPLSAGNAAAKIAASTWTGPTYYVATNGVDNPAGGSAAAPWKTIQYAANHVPAGGTVLVHGGVYKELVTISRSGSAQAGFITLASVPGETATIDGTGLPIPNGQQGLITLVNASYVRVIGFELRNYSTSQPNVVPLGLYAYGSGDHIEVRNNHIHDITTLDPTTNAGAFGLAFYGTAATPITNVTIDGNELDHLKTGYSESLTVNGNVMNWQVTNNQVHDNNNIGIVAIGFEGTAPKGSPDQARNGWIAGNNVYNITSANNPSYSGQSSADGIYVDGGTRITIERNRVTAADLGIELASEHSGRTSSYVTARSNLVLFSNVTGISIGGYASGVGGTDHCTIVNNTLFENDTTTSGTGEFQIQYHATSNVFANNILYANDQGLLVNSFVPSSTSPAALDDNIYYSTAGADAANWVWNGNSLTDFASFKQASRGEVSGILADPLFTNAATPDLHLATGSPGIDRGFNLGLAVEGAQDFAGNPRIAGAGIDRGAYER